MRILATHPCTHKMDKTQKRSTPGWGYSVLVSTPDRQHGRAVDHQNIPQSPTSRTSSLTRARFQTQPSTTSPPPCPLHCQRCRHTASSTCFPACCSSPRRSGEFRTAFPRDLHKVAVHTKGTQVIKKHPFIYTIGLPRNGRSMFRQTLESVDMQPARTRSEYLEPAASRATDHLNDHPRLNLTAETKIRK